MTVTKGFSNQWEEIYVRGEQNSTWPWSDLVSLVNRHCKNIMKLDNSRIFELGPGSGANIPFFLSVGMDYHAMEGSHSVVQRLHEQFPKLSKQIVVGDFTSERLSPYSSFFDLIVDRGSLTHNNQVAIESAIQSILKSLKIGGYFIGVDWFSVNNYMIALQAAADGTGIVLGWRHLCKPKIDSGELVVLGNTSIPAPSAIYIMSEKEELLPNNVKALRDFLISKT